MSAIVAADNKIVPTISRQKINVFLNNVIIYLVLRLTH